MSRKNSDIVPEILRYVYAILTNTENFLCQTYDKNNGLFLLTLADTGIFANLQGFSAHSVRRTRSRASFIWFTSDLLAFFFLFEAHSHPCGASIKPAASSIVHLQPLEISQQISLKFKSREKNSINYCNF